LSGIYIGNIGNCGCSTEPNYDRVTPMYGIGALKGKGSRAKNAYNKEVDSYKYFVYNVDNGRVEAGFEYKQDAIDTANDYDNASVISLSQLIKNGLEDPRPRWKYIDGIGAVYNYNHPKSVTHCFDGTYSDAGKGACAYHGGSHEVKVNRKGQRVYTGKGEVMHYVPYRRKYKTDWARSNRKSDKVRTL
jgi:hypothetical protein